MSMNYRVNIIGAGLAGMSAAIELASQGLSSNLVSLLPSDRAQSLLAEGGINGALNTMGDDDKVEDHFRDTMAGGVYLGDPKAVEGLASNAPDIIRWLQKLGVPFNMEDGHLAQRYFGGQKKRRTAFAKSSTGKAIVNALIDEARKYEAQGLITRYPHHGFVKLIMNNGGQLIGALVQDTYNGEYVELMGPVILASGGLNGFFPEMTTGTTQNRGEVTTRVFSQGVRLSNLEMIQYHPTTVGIYGKRMLISEAARGEGGRLFVNKMDPDTGKNQRYYFMEDKYPELGNLMPRDVVSREVDAQDGQVYLDLRGLSKEIWEKKLPDMRKELLEYVGIDAAEEPVPVDPGIHYFMGGIDVDIHHRTNIDGLFAAGECCSQYHGANRLGANSMLGALYGGKVAANSAAKILEGFHASEPRRDNVKPNLQQRDLLDFDIKLRDILLQGMGIVRSEEEILEALSMLEDLRKEMKGSACDDGLKEVLVERLNLAQAMLESALGRKESRGAHSRVDYPETSPTIEKTYAKMVEGDVKVYLREASK